MSPRFQRLLMILTSLTLITGSLFLILNNSKKNITFFYTPSELTEANVSINQKIRIGGFIKKESIKKISTSKPNIIFTVTDGENDILVEYNGILPSLFREGQGVIVQGYLKNSTNFVADEVLAKHDENYMPPEVAEALKKSGKWKEKAE